MHDSHPILINSSKVFEHQYHRKIESILATEPYFRGPAHAMRDDETSYTHELLHVTEKFWVPVEVDHWADVVKPNLPWAEDHFQERVGGEPLNPAPSEAWWPYARAGNAEHKRDKVFSHTYPERFWPKYAGGGSRRDQPHLQGTYGNIGIRFSYGDLIDLVRILRNNPNSRQAYLPVWFPEDLAAGVEGQRVPCSLGYHFMVDSSTSRLDCVYTLRSCDLVRFYRDDMYMAGRLLQWVCEEANGSGIDFLFTPGKLVTHVNNLHCFPADGPHLRSMLPKFQVSSSVADKRAGYNFGALG